MEFLVLLLIVGLFALWVSNRGLKARVERLERLVEDVSVPADVRIVEPAAAPPEPEAEVRYNVGHTRVPESPPAAAAGPLERGQSRRRHEHIAERIKADAQDIGRLVPSLHGVTTPPPRRALAAACERRAGREGLRTRPESAR